MSGLRRYYIHLFLTTTLFPLHHSLANQMNFKNFRI